MIGRFYREDARFAQMAAISHFDGLVSKMEFYDLNESDKCENNHLNIFSNREMNSIAKPNLVSCKRSFGNVLVTDCKSICFYYIYLKTLAQ